MAMAAMRRQGNYLRVRGEYTAEQLETLYSEELPPRARRILVRTGDEFHL